MADSGAPYALIGGLAVVVAGAGLFIAHEHGAFDSRTIAAVTAPSAVPVPAPSPTLTPTTPTAEMTPVQRLVDDARRALTRGDLAAADRALDQAESIDSRDRDVQQARAELDAAQRTPERGDNDRNGSPKR